MEKTDVCKATVDTRFSLNTYDELLTLCARIQTSASHESQIQTIINRGIDFEKLLQKATWQRLQGLVAAHLSASYLENVVPITVKDQCMAIRRQILFRNVLLQNETARLLALFHEEHIPIIVLKGAALLDTVYNDISLRPMGDLDVLVHSNDLDRAETLASNAGYWCPVDEATQEKTRKYGQHIPLLVHSEKGIIFEIHHHIVGPESPYRGSIDSFWERARATEIGGVPAHMLSPEHMIIHQCIKFLLDRRYQSAKSLGQLCDIAEIITRYQDCLDWDLIGETAHEIGLGAGLHVVLFTCHHLLETPVPTAILTDLMPPDFNPADARLFISRRVLDMKPWNVHGLSDSESAHHGGRIRTILDRIVAFYRGNGKTDRNVLQRIGAMLTRLMKSAANPAELKEDLYLDQWLHNLQGPPTKR